MLKYMQKRIPAAKWPQIASFPTAHVSEHQQPLDILHTFWPAKKIKNKKAK